jgi:aromatic ring hydroxylase
MVLDTKKPQGAHNAARYKESLRDGREVWFDGEKVKDVTTHPAFASTIDEMARIYKLQHTDKYRDQMTFVPPDLLPQFVLGLYNNKEALSAVKNPHCDFGENVVNYHTYCQENDIFLTHALGDQQVDRSQQPQNETRQIKGEELALHVVEETNEGIIVSGANQLSSAAHMSNDTYVSLSATFVRRADPGFIQAFSIPSNSKGLKIICREPVSQYPGTYGHPFGVKCDEQDSMLFFDNVMVPWDRVFMLYDASAMVQRLAGGANFMGWSNYIRIHERM